MFIQIENTPNPETLKFLISSDVGGVEGGMEFSDAGAARGFPLAELLFEVSGVVRVFFGGDFVSITKSPDVSWDVVRPEVLVVMTDYFASHGSLDSPAGHMQNAGSEAEEEFFDEADSDVVTKVKELIENFVKPAVAQDGGDIRFRGYKEGVVFVHLRGACSGCPSAAITLKDGVYSMLSYYVPEVKAVESV
ncbi:MAG: NifU family protein [Anaplasma sp.]